MPLVISRYPALRRSIGFYPHLKLAIEAAAAAADVPSGQVHWRPWPLPATVPAPVRVRSSWAHRVEDVADPRRARHGPPTHELGAQHDAISQARAACFDSTVGLDARTPAKCQELLVAAEKASQSALSSLSRAATFPSLLNAAIATYC